jgi:hypothetical protein
VLLCASATSATAAPLAVKAGHLLDPATEKVRDNAVLVIENGRVTAIGDKVPDGAEVLDLSQRWVLPGFIDAHTHVLLQGDATEADYNEQALGESLAYRALRATKAMRIALDHGFTSLRDLGTEGAGFADVDLKRAVELGIVPGPRLFVSTKALAPTGAYGPNLSWQIDVPKVSSCATDRTAAAAPSATTSRTAPTGSRSTPTASTSRNPMAKSARCPNFTADELAAIVDQTHRTGLRVAAHSMTPTGTRSRSAPASTRSSTARSGRRVHRADGEEGRVLVPDRDHAGIRRAAAQQDQPDLGDAAPGAAGFVQARAQGRREDRARHRCRRLSLGRPQPGDRARLVRRARHDVVAGAARAPRPPGPICSTQGRARHARGRRARGPGRARLAIPSPDITATEHVAVVMKDGVVLK